MSETIETAEKEPAPTWYGRFLAQLRKLPNISEAARAAKVGRATVYRYRESDPAFAAAWDDALGEAIDALVGEAYRRAFRGVKRSKGVYYEGEKVATETITEYSDTLAIFLLKAHRPEVYRETSNLRLGGPNGEPLPLPGIREVIVTLKHEPLEN